MIMSTNAGSKLLKVDGDVKGFGVAKYNPVHMANIMGFSHMTDKYHGTYDNKKEDAFHVHTDQGVIKFTCEGRLYTYKPSKKYLAAVKATNDKKPNKKRYEQFLATDHGTLAEHLTDLQHSVNRQKQRPQKRNDTSAQTNNNDGE